MKPSLLFYMPKNLGLVMKFMKMLANSSTPRSHPEIDWLWT